MKSTNFWAVWAIWSKLLNRQVWNLMVAAMVAKRRRENEEGGVIFRVRFIVDAQGGAL